MYLVLLQTTTLRRKKILFNAVLILLWDNIEKVKTSCNVVLEAPDNNAQEKILLMLP